MAEGQEDGGAALEAAAEGVEAPALTETEQLAQEMGWKPQTDYKGDPDKWRPAKDFILAERDISRTMRNEVKRLGNTVERMAAAGTKQTERMLNEQADRLNREFAQAVEAKDTRGAAKAAQGMRDLEATARADQEGSDVRFARDNPWYGKDDEATAYAVSVSQRLAAQGKSADDQLEAAATAVRKRFPELFETERKPARTAPTLHAPTPSPAKRGKTFADLPPAVKQAAESHARLAASKFGVDPEKAKASYASDYFADQAA